MKAPLVLLAGILVATLSTPSLAQDDARDMCIAASESGQRLRDAHKLSKAREQFLTCANEKCPSAMRQVCVDDVADVMKRMPSVVIRAKDVLDVTVTIDRQIVTRKLDGSAVPLDPGAHDFRLETAGFPPIDRQVLLAEGEQNRVLEFVFERDGQAVTPANHPAPVVEGRRGFPVVATIFAGLGVAALATGAIVGAIAQSEFADADRTCKPNCPLSQVDGIRTKYNAANVAFGVGIGAAIGATILYIIHFARRPSPSRVSFAVGPTPGGADATVVLPFLIGVTSRPS